MESIDVYNVDVKWNTREFRIRLKTTATVGDLKSELQRMTGVEPQNQKLSGFRRATRVCKSGFGEEFDLFDMCTGREKISVKSVI